MPRRRRFSKHRVAELTEDQEWELELGPRHSYHGQTCPAPGHRRLPAGVRELHPDSEPVECSWFASPPDREIAWWLHRERLLSVASSGDRPWAYFEYELREHPPWPPGVAAFLVERGLLSDEEEAEILTWSKLYSYPDWERVWGSPYPNRYAAAAQVIRERRGVSEASAILARSGEEV